MLQIDNILSRFPKTRPILPEEFRAIYKTHYRQNRKGETPASSLSQKMEGWLHKKVAADVLLTHDKATLEIGAGTLNQLRYEKTGPYDIVEPFSELYRNSTCLTRINKIYNDIDDICDSVKYDRITAVATFEHLTNLPLVVARTCLLLKDNGTLRISIPNEGSFLWKLGWKITTGLEFRIRYRLDYGILMAHEHVNSAEEIDQILRYFYGNVKRSFFGISKDLAFYRFYECTDPMKAKAEIFSKNL